MVDQQKVAVLATHHPVLVFLCVGNHNDPQIIKTLSSFHQIFHRVVSLFYCCIRNDGIRILELPSVRLREHLSLIRNLWPETLLRLEGYC